MTLVTKLTSQVQKCVWCIREGGLNGAYNIISGYPFTMQHMNDSGNRRPIFLQENEAPVKGPVDNRQTCRAGCVKLAIYLYARVCGGTGVNHTLVRLACMVAMQPYTLWLQCWLMRYLSSRQGTGLFDQ